MDKKIEKITFFLFCLVALAAFSYRLVLRIERSRARAPEVAVTIPEGFDNSQIAEVCSKVMPDFNRNNFLELAQNKVGYLFPDTYLFLLKGTETDVIKSMSDNFDKKIVPVLPEIISSGKTEGDVITMASIIEKEAEGPADRAVISGILWKRISIGMQLEVDSAPETYKTKGLPTSPIDNPGLDAIEAAIHPQTSPYLYYLHDKNGGIHYAATLAEQDKNIVKYLTR